MKTLIAGNWKMNLDRDTVNQLTYDLMQVLPSKPSPDVEVLLCPPYLYLDRSNKFWGETPTMIGAQNCASHENGAYTGEISAQQLLDIGCSYVIVGHSERRQILGETNDIVKQKAAMALEYRLKPIICIGETQTERDDGHAEKIIASQLAKCVPDGAKGANIVIAYEPVWAIGTGKTATHEDIQTMHAFIRNELANKIDGADSVRILYGGSMNADNARDILTIKNVNGGLIGGASLTADSFFKIIKSTQNS